MPLPFPSRRFIIPDMPSAEEVLPYLRQIDENRWYSNFGPLVQAVEKRFADLMAGAHGEKNPHPCVAMASGTQALAVGLRLLGVGPKKKVLVPAITFPACPLAVESLGATPILADIDSESWVLTPEIALNVAEKNRIDAVMPVSLYGLPLPASEWDVFIEKTGIPVLIDAAAGVENQRYPQKALVAHSLHALKALGIGEGGLLVTPDEKTAAIAKKIINFGMDGRISLTAGENGKMSEYHAAVALAQLDRWPKIKEGRKKVQEAYLSALAPLEGQISLNQSLKELVVTYFMISIKSKISEVVFAEMNKRGVPAHRTYLPPLYTHPHFQALSLATAEGRVFKTTSPQTKAQRLRSAEAVNRSVLGLPFHAFLNQKDVQNVCRILAEILA